jgi:hypothetical protein
MPLKEEIRASQSVCTLRGYFVLVSTQGKGRATTAGFDKERARFQISPSIHSFPLSNRKAWVWV